MVVLLQHNVGGASDGQTDGTMQTGMDWGQLGGQELE